MTCRYFARQITLPMAVFCCFKTLTWPEELWIWIEVNLYLTLFGGRIIEFDNVPSKLLIWILVALINLTAEKSAKKCAVQDTQDRKVDGEVAIHFRAILNGLPIVGNLVLGHVDLKDCVKDKCIAFRFKIIKLKMSNFGDKWLIRESVLETGRNVFLNVIEFHVQQNGLQLVRFFTLVIFLRIYLNQDINLKKNSLFYHMVIMLV